MKKSLLALAVLGTAAGAASAQSSVTVYGRVDLSFAQRADSVEDKEIRNGSGSRLGFRGVEDLGGGLKALFQFEHRFNADTGTQSTNNFWEGKSVVGLEGAFGRVLLGREENPAYTYGQTPADPWGTDTVAANTTIINGGIGTTRYSDSVNYRFSAAGFTFGAQIAEAATNVPATSGATTGNPAEDKPYSVGLGYAAGPFAVGIGYENPADTDDNWTSGFVSYNLGFLKLGGFYGSGKNAAAQKIESYLVSATAPIGGGELRASYGERKNKNLATNQKLDKQFGLGYHYALSKRTTIYADYVNENRDGIDNAVPSRESNGYDLGIKHNF